MPNEIENILISLITIIPSLIFCYSIKTIIPKGFIRFLFIFPIIIFFLLLPLQFHSIHLQGSIGFLISWLATFKLVLFSFDKGPFSSPSSSSSLLRFLIVCSLPIEIQHRKTTTRFSKPFHNQNHTLFSLSTKFGFFIISLSPIYYQNYLHPKIAMVSFSLVIYLILEFFLGITAALTKSALGVEIEPPFNEPYLSTSLQDFWGRRWNLMVTRILRPTVYEPVRGFFRDTIAGGRWASTAAITATFLVSGLMHELIFYYMGRMKPTWEVTCFFLLHGICLPVEIMVKRAVGDWFRPPLVVSTALTIGFVMGTSFLLFFPQFLRLRANERMFEEYAVVGAFVKSVYNEVILVGEDEVVEVVLLDLEEMAFGTWTCMYIFWSIL